MIMIYLICSQSNHCPKIVFSSCMPMWAKITQILLKRWLPNFTGAIIQSRSLITFYTSSTKIERMMDGWIRFIKKLDEDLLSRCCCCSGVPTMHIHSTTLHFTKNLHLIEFPQRLRYIEFESKTNMDESAAWVMCRRIQLVW